jgi:thiamine-phosphate diphosphorylase/hydroxyethylthiazole kinase
MTELLTWQVVQNFAANVALCVGASPIMANYAEEAADLAKLGGALVLNMGTVTPEGLRNYVQALKAYNDAKRPVVLDPVGCEPQAPPPYYPWHGNLTPCQRGSNRCPQRGC